MKDIQIFKSTMSSLEIAELTGKQHAHIMRDIRTLLEQGVSESNFGLSSYKQPQPKGGYKEVPCYELTKKGCLILASGYDALLREKIINRWEELETEKQSQCEKKLPQTYLEALKELVVAVEENERLLLENSAMKPKAEYFDKLVDRNLLTNLRDTAKELKIPQNTFISLLLENKYVYRDAKRKLKPYAEHTPSLFELKDYEHNGHTGTQLFITPKGKETFRLMFCA